MYYYTVIYGTLLHYDSSLSSSFTVLRQMATDKIRYIKYTQTYKDKKSRNAR